MSDSEAVEAIKCYDERFADCVQCAPGDLRRLIREGIQND